MNHSVGATPIIGKNAWLKFDLVLNPARNIAWVTSSPLRNSVQASAIRQPFTTRLTFSPRTRVEADLNLPLYDGDVEANAIPAAVQILADQIAQADAVIIATPEYNKALSGVLKNARTTKGLQELMDGLRAAVHAR